MYQPKVHELKTDTEYFKAVVQGHKLVEIRIDDRGFRQGDYLFLRETTYSGKQMREGCPLIYTGCTAMVLVTHIHTAEGMAKEGFAPWVAMSIKVVSKATGGKYGN